MAVLTLLLVLDYYPPKDADAVRNRNPAEPYHSYISEQSTQHKLSIIAQNAAVIDSL